MWDLPGPGLESMSPALAGRFLTTAPPGKSQDCFIIKYCSPMLTSLLNSNITFLNACLSPFFSILTAANFIWIRLNFPYYSEGHWDFPLNSLFPLNPFYTLLPDRSWTKSICLALVFKAFHDLTSAYFFSLFPFTLFPMYLPVLQSVHNICLLIYPKVVMCSFVCQRHIIGGLCASEILTSSNKAIVV